MRGKHGVAAEKRRTAAELEERASSAEHRAEKAEAALAELKEKSERQIAGLRAELANSVKDRDEGTSPQLEAAHERFQQLAQELLSTKRDLSKLEASRAAYVRTAFAFLGEKLTAAGMDQSALPGIAADLQRRLRATAAGERQGGTGGLRPEVVQ